MTRPSLINRVLRVCLIGLAFACLSGCLLQSTAGNVVIVADTDAQEQLVTTLMLSRATAAVCIAGPVGDCTYVFGGHTEDSTFTAYPGEAISSLIVDPPILEVPANVISATGTYDAGSGPQPLIIDRRDSFAVQPGKRITAEVGTTFLFLDVPGSATSGLPSGDPAAGPVFSYTLSFQQVVPISQTVPPVKVKPMLAGALTVLWQNYYIPILPCVEDFSLIPAVIIPQANSPQDLETTLGDLAGSHQISPCNHKLYDFSLAKPPAGLAFLPLMRR